MTFLQGSNKRLPWQHRGEEQGSGELVTSRQAGICMSCCRVNEQEAGQRGTWVPFPERLSISTDPML